MRHIIAVARAWQRASEATITPADCAFVFARCRSLPFSALLMTPADTMARLGWRTKPRCRSRDARCLGATSEIGRMITSACNEGVIGGAAEIVAEGIEAQKPLPPSYMSPLPYRGWGNCPKKGKS